MALDAREDLAIRCIFCGASDNPPSIDHIVPAGLGFHVDLCLSLGAVCEPCNNHYGRQIDEAMVHLFEVRLIRAHHHVPDRHGRVITEIPLSNGVMRFLPEGKFAIEVFGGGHIQEKTENTVTINVIDTRKKSGDQWRRATRSLMKSGMALLCHQAGVESTFHPDWDPLRAAIQGEPYDGYLLIGPFDIFAKPNFSISLTRDVPGVEFGARLRFGGLDLTVDLIPKPAPGATKKWAQENGFQVMDIAPLKR